MTRTLFRASLALATAALLPSPATAAPLPTPASVVTQASPACVVQRSGGVLDGPGTTFERLIDTSPTIVEAIVQSTAPGRFTAPPEIQAKAPGGGPREIDITLVARRAIKGTAPQDPFVIARLPATGFFDMQPGQRYVLFLGPLDERAAAVYAASPVKNRMRANLGGALCVDEANVVHVSTEGGFIRHLDNLPLEKAVGEIASYAQLPRVRGRIVVEGGTFPPAHLPTPLPATIEIRARLRVLATPSKGATTLRPVTAIVAPPVLPRQPPNQAAAPAGDVTDATPRLVSIDNTGAFEMPIAAGEYGVTVEALPFGYIVRSITYAARDMRREPLHIDAAPAELVVTLAPVTSGVIVSGRITGLPPDTGGARLLVALTSSGAGDERSGAVQAASDGSFEFRNVPPGQYTMSTHGSLPMRIATNGQLSTLPVTVGAQPVTADIPLFAGAPGTAQLGATPEVFGSSPIFLRFTPSGGGAVVTVSLRDPVMFWLPRGEFQVSATVLGNPGTLPVMSGPIDVSKALLKSDGATPLPPMVVMPAAGSGGR